ncbi:MAG: tRNA (5-methylaminomethyl-2-thiouridylate)-methyltransferase, partial [Gammaproteobacteria bacterium]|nr:tRNA (5-methylaminomethyl-2-thiouridylate)-methyltransferase [Gammaproteobacteria bacterium]
MTRKAVALISGGLDSLLAARLIQEQGIQVEGINFYTGF